MTKKLVIESESDKLELGGVSVENDLQNDLETFNKPNRDGGSKETRALNLNQIEENYTIKARMDDATTSALNSDLSNKEEAKDRLKDIMLSADHLTLTYGDEEVKGYITKLNIKEQGDDDATVYRFQMDFRQAVPMTS